MDRHRKPDGSLSPLSLPINALVPAGACTSLDGAGTRRQQLLSCLESLGILRRHDIPSPPEGSNLNRFQAWISRVHTVIQQVSTFGNETCLMFYPDFPAFHPPGWIKLCGLLLIAIHLRSFRRRGTLWIDIVDLPRWQSPDLGYPLRLYPPALRLAERILFRSADHLSIPSKSMADLVGTDLGLSPDRLSILPNAARQSWFDNVRRLPAKINNPIRFFYCGSLSQATGRKLETLLKAFVQHAKTGTELHLVGPDGQWIHRTFSHPGVKVYPARADEAWLSLARKCHVGLVPYPEQPYYSMCMPSKVAAYAACGLRILSTKITETTKLIEHWQLGTSRSISEFANIFAHPHCFVSELDKQNEPPSGWKEALCWENQLSYFLGTIRLVS